MILYTYTCTNINIITLVRIIKHYSFIYENLLRAFRYCCLFCISPHLYNSSIRFDASVRVLLSPDNFKPSKTSSLV